MTHSKMVHVRMPEPLILELQKIADRKGNTLSAEMRQRLDASLKSGGCE